MSSPSPGSSDPTSPATARSHAEQSLSARVGAVLFRNRSWLPVPFLLIALLAPSHANGYNWLVGSVVIVLGECVRLAGVAVAGTVTRRRSRDVQRLVNYGVFAWVRNPLYVGNFLIWMGFVVISGVMWFLPVAIVIFMIEYSLIVAYEEGVLESIFGADYLAYKQTTPRWIPRPPRERVEGPHSWKEAWRSEISTFMQYGALIVVFAVKQKVWWA
ncbi:MAG TPA: isoprenylcysteine carboxylmethyltransferase family protein [Gemmatimonadaceae bacterium]|jgi:protein-S-isoprenylcysteine O-methyltransferase Ste14|nr:isoprenylcysteine carboxylmethyltransferase family protein [Gemmatimonadaceae bacterium]